LIKLKSGYQFISETIQERNHSFNSDHWNRMKTLRRGPTTVRLERPINLPRARSVGYKAKQGYLVCVTKVRKGTMHKIRPKMGRKNANLAVNKITTKKNLQWIAEERTAKKYPNLEVLNSYRLYTDGKVHFFEIILVDPNHPRIISDPKINWIGFKNNYKRVYRGLTSAGKKVRSLRNKGRGAEKIRPSLRANRNLR
jgi:large subunit ribosomal protein L15e